MKRIMLIALVALTVPMGALAACTDEEVAKAIDVKMLQAEMVQQDDIIAQRQQHKAYLTEQIERKQNGGKTLAEINAEVVTDEK